MSTITVGFLRQVAAHAEAEARRLAPYANDQDIDAEPLAFFTLATIAEACAKHLEARPAPNEIESDRALVKRLLAVEGGFSEWEVNFVESISRWVETQALTPAQRNRAEQLDGR